MKKNINNSIYEDNISWWMEKVFSKITQNTLSTKGRQCVYLKYWWYPGIFYNMSVLHVQSEAIWFKETRLQYWRAMKNFENQDKISNSKKWENCRIEEKKKQKPMVS